MTDKPLPKWKITSSRFIIKDRWLTLRADNCVTPAGETIDPWYVLEYSTWVNCIAIDDNFNVLLLKHYRHGINNYVTEILSGVVDSDDASPESAVRRELTEELGYRGGELYQTGVSYTNPSNQNNEIHSFLAIGGSCTAKKLDETGADFTVLDMSFQKFIKLFSESDASVTFQGLHLAAVFLGLNFIASSTYRSERLEKLKMLAKQI